MTPRGIRNNNPGNIREAPGDKTHWVGERATDDDPAFEEFETPRHGIRALYIVLRGYQRAHGLKTIRQMVNRWAPPVENKTDAYVDAVAGACGVKPDAPFDIVNSRRNAISMVAAIIRHENGQQPFSAAEIRTAIEMA